MRARIERAAEAWAAQNGFRWASGCGDWLREAPENETCFRLQLKDTGLILTLQNQAGAVLTTFFAPLQPRLGRLDLVGDLLTRSLFDMMTKPPWQRPSVNRVK